MTPRGSASTTTWQGALVVFLCLTAALTPGGVAGQGVTGVVVEAQSSAPLPGVLVAVESEAGTRVGAVLSDASGRFVVEVPRAGRFRAVAARIGLATTTTEMFEVPAGDVHFVRVTMADNAVELEGFVVDTRVQGCRIDPAEALQIQRWWDEIRKALEVSSVVQKDQLARFRIQKYEREWSADLKSLSGERTELQIGFATRPFVSASAEFLTEGGFVQGAEGDREYYAPDADVLLADVFLAQHCFSVVDHDEDRDLIGLHFEPTRTRRVPDVLGTLWVDSTTAELQSLEYRYANIDWLPANESGGEVRFRYLPSGTWIVSDWYIRMPQVGVRYGPGSVSRSEVAGSFDVGGRVRQIATEQATEQRDRRRSGERSSTVSGADRWLERALPYWGHASRRIRILMALLRLVGCRPVSIRSRSSMPTCHSGEWRRRSSRLPWKTPTGRTSSWPFRASGAWRPVCARVKATCGPY